MITGNWHSSAYRKLHLDWHQPAWIKKPASAMNALTARAQARMFKRAGIQAVEFFVYDHYGQAFFPSRKGVRHPHFKPDYPGLMVEALHAEKLKAIGYMNVLTSVHLAAGHPDWFIRLPDGSNPRGAWLLQPHSWICLASPYADDYFLPLVEEVLERYPLDGLWLDALCWMVDAVCHCPACVRRFQQISGARPPQERPQDLSALSASERALWFAWKTYRLGLITEFHDKVVLLAHRLRPGIVVMDNNAGQATRPMVESDGGRFVRWISSSELKVDAFSCDPVPMGGNHEVMLSFHARHQITTGKSYDYMNERFHCWGEWQTRSVTDWQLEFATILANGGKCFFADNPYPDGTLEPRVYELLKASHEFVKAREPVCLGAEPVYEIGILAAAASQAFGLPPLHDAPGCLPVPGFSDRIAGAHLAAVELGWQAHIFDEPTLLRHLSSLRCVVVPDQELLADSTVEALAGFVGNGGRLLLTGGCGRFDDQFRERTKWPFEKLAGLRFRGEWPAPVNYFRPTGKLASLSRDLEELPVECWGRAMKFELAGARILSPMSGPIDDVWQDGRRVRENFQHHTVTGACPPSRETQGGAVFFSRHGRGAVMTMAMDPFARYSVEGHRLLRGLIEAAFEKLYPGSERVIYSADKPRHIEMHVMHQAGKWVLHAVNFFAQKRRGSMVTNDEVAESRAFVVELRSPFPFRRATREPEGTLVKLVKSGPGVRVKIVPFELHTAVLLHGRKTGRNNL